jgi:predicted  nucleic acid-binding Zn-ribbon protein
MKEYLENLEIGEGKVKLSKDEIKSILAESGKIVTNETEKTKKDLNTEIETYKTTITDLQDKIGKLPKSDELEALKKEIQTMKDAETQRITDEKAKKDEEILTNNIKSAFGDKKFINEYTQNAIINDVKSALKDVNNQGKSAKDLFEELTKEKEGIFANPNQVINTGTPGEVNKNLTEDARNRELIGLSKEDKK